MPWVRCEISSRRAVHTIIVTGPTDRYQFEASKALVEDKHFVVWVSMRNRQPELTAARVEAWLQASSITR
jgi:flavodoxin I